MFLLFQNDRPFTAMELELIKKNDKINKLRDENSTLKTTIEGLPNQNKQQVKQREQQAKKLNN